MLLLGVQFRLVTICLVLQASGAMQDAYDLITGYLCIKSDFIETPVGSGTDISCAFLCSNNPRCQAFSMADGPCQLFVFDKCSKSVRDCSCSRRGQVFVKQQPGLEAGSLCPSGYGDDLCGVKYKLYNGTGNWWQSRQKCESESGLVIMADVMDATEMSHVNFIHDLRSSGQSFFLGGFQPAGSQEPAGGWFWVGCNITLDSSLWNLGEPNDVGNDENVVASYLGIQHLTDVNEATSAVSTVLCECVSPFS